MEFYRIKLEIILNYTILILLISKTIFEIKPIKNKKETKKYLFYKIIYFILKQNMYKYAIFIIVVF